MKYPASWLLLAISFFTPHLIISQSLQPGFNPRESKEMFHIAAFTNSNGNTPEERHRPERFRMVYQSGSMGLENSWDLWTDQQGNAVISIRGTTPSAVSWLANFYAAMIPAKGELEIAPGRIFPYHLADDPRAAVHVGWTVALGFLSEDILPKLDSCYQTGIRNFFITGHSQGGAISYLLTAMVHKMQENGELPGDIRFKTYCGAAPKPGNLFFAYEYEFMTQGGWAYNVVNSADWVPQVPISIQTDQDFSTTNPFVNARQVIRKQKFPRNMALKHVYNNLVKPPKKAQRNYEKFLGRTLSKTISRTIPGFVPPDFYSSNHYVRTGQTIILFAERDENYFEKFPDSKENIFTHHLIDPYVLLLEKQYPGQ